VFNIKGEYKYCTIEVNDEVVHFGELVDSDVPNVTIIDYITSEIIEYSIDTPDCTITFEEADRYDELNQIKADERITSSDFNVIFKSKIPMPEYRTIRGLRDLGFMVETSVDEVDMVSFKETASRTIASDLEKQVTEVRNDSDLSECEVSKLTDICTNAHQQFERLIASATSIKEILESWPNILLIDKPYLSYMRWEFNDK